MEFNNNRDSELPVQHEESNSKYRILPEIVSLLEEFFVEYID
jgi:hypothetical protein